MVEKFNPTSDFPKLDRTNETIKQLEKIGNSHTQRV
jgi:hypothetical protein